jgi:hypothetical protein
MTWQRCICMRDSMVGLAGLVVESCVKGRDHKGGMEHEPVALASCCVCAVIQVMLKGNQSVIGW